VTGPPAGGRPVPGRVAGADGPPEGAGPARAVRESLDYLRGLLGGQR
jgi:hypothetical protein